MTFVGGCENYVASGPTDALFTFSQYLIGTVGWTLTASSDGSGGAVTGSSSGANGLDNNFAYMELRDPGSTYRWQFQRSNTASTHWRYQIFYGTSSGGTATKVPTPAGTVKWVHLGGGTDASPTFEQVFASAGTVVFHGVASNTPHALTGVYPLWYAAHASGDARISSPFLLDAVDGHPNDTYPLVSYSKYTTSASYYSFAPYYSSWGTVTEQTVHTGTSNAGKIVAPMGPSGTTPVLQMCASGAGANIWALSYGSTSEHHPWAWDASLARLPIYIGTSQTGAHVVGVGLKGSFASMKSNISGLLVLGDTHDVNSADPWVCTHDYAVSGGSGCPGVVLPWVTGSNWQMS